MIVVYEVPIMFIVFIVGAILGLNLVDVCFWISWIVGTPTVLFSIVTLIDVNKDKTVNEDDKIGFTLLSIILIIFFVAMIIIFTILFNNKVYFNGLDLLEWFFSL